MSFTDTTLAANEVQREAEQRSQVLEERLAMEAESTRLHAEVEKQSFGGIMWNASES